MKKALALALLSLSSDARTGKHIIVVIADDLGANDLGVRNGGRTLTPTIDSLIADGITMTSYYTFKICSPSRASALTGRYPWGAGFYDMSLDPMHTTHNFTLYPHHLRAGGYKTHALGFVEAPAAPRAQNQNPHPSATPHQRPAPMQ